MNKALQDVVELQKVIFDEVFQKVFDHGYNCTSDSCEKQVAELRQVSSRKAGLPP